MLASTSPTTPAEERTHRDTAHACSTCSAPRSVRLTYRPDPLSLALFVSPSRSFCRSLLSPSLSLSPVRETVLPSPVTFPLLSTHRRALFTRHPALLCNFADTTAQWRNARGEKRRKKARAQGQIAIVLYHSRSRTASARNEGSGDDYCQHRSPDPLCASPAVQYNTHHHYTKGRKIRDMYFLIWDISAQGGEMRFSSARYAMQSRSTASIATALCPCLSRCASCPLSPCILSSHSSSLPCRDHRYAAHAPQLHSHTATALLLQSSPHRFRVVIIATLRTLLSCTATQRQHCCCNRLLPPALFSAHSSVSVRFVCGIQLPSPGRWLRGPRSVHADQARRAALSG